MWDRQEQRLRAIAARWLGLCSRQTTLSAVARSIYTDVTEELAYLADACRRYRRPEELGLASADLDDASRQLIRHVLVDSALHRLAQELAP